MIDWMMRLALGKVKDVRRRKNYITTLLVILATGFLQTLTASSQNLLISSFTPLVVHVAQTQPAQDEFVPIDELPPEDQLPAAPLLIAAYAFAWIALLIYIWSLWRRLGLVERELADVARRISNRSGGA